MSIFNEFPYTNMHELNLDWILQEMKKLQKSVSTMAIESRTFDNVSDMASDDTLGAGSVVYVNGFYNSGDGGQGLYYISDTDEGLGIAISGGLYANPIIDWCYNLKQLGAKADGFTNDLPVIQGLLTKINNGVIANKPVYAPSGRYCVNDCIVIPSNIWLFGDGESTYFYLNRSSNWSGQVIGVCGSNVILERINGGYLGGAEANIEWTQAQEGFIGIGPSSYDGWIDHQTILEPHSNIICRDIWSDCQYALQTENTDAGTLINNVTYENVHAPNALVSVQAKSPDTIKNVYMNNIECAVIRLGQGNRVENLVLDNFRCELLINRNQGSLISNGYAKIIPGSKAYNSNIWVNYGNAPVATKTGCSLMNVISDANNVLNDGLNVETTAELTSENEPVCLTNVTTLNPLVYSIHGGGYVEAVNCSFDVNLPARLNATKAKLTNCVMYRSLYANTNNAVLDYLEYETGYADYSVNFPGYYERSGNWVKVCAMISASGFTAGDTIATLPDELKPAQIEHGIGNIQDVAQGGLTSVHNEAVVVSVDTDGNISVGASGVLAQDLADATILKFDFTYPVIPNYSTQQ